MKKEKWDDFEYGAIEDTIGLQTKKNSKQRNRKWREIENIKEQKRLREELADYDSYNY